MAPKVVVAEVIDLDTPLERAWEFVSNFETFPQWFTLHEGFPAAPPPQMHEVGLGTVVTEKIKVMGIPADVEWTVVEWEPLHVVGIDGKGPMGTTMRIRALVESSDTGGTRFTHESSFGGAAITPMLSVLEKEARKAAAQSVQNVRALLGEAAPA
jgi:carbon monoxide dehydrogenase subunit G